MFTVQMGTLRPTEEGSYPRSLSCVGAELEAEGINNNSYLFTEHLLCVSTARSPLCIFPDSHYNNGIASVTVPILLMRFVKPREVRWLVRRHTASQLFH